MGHQISKLSLHLLKLTQMGQDEPGDMADMADIEGRRILTNEDTCQYRRKLKNDVYKLYQIGERIQDYTNHTCVW